MTPPVAPDPTLEGGERRRLVAIACVFAALAGLALVDLLGDLREGTTRIHVALEGSIVLVGAVGVALLARRYLQLRRRELAARRAARELSHDLEESRAEAERWRAEALHLVRGLGALIDEQLQRWALSAAEKEVALLLLKGWSHKEIAHARSVGEATVRQQAAAVYRKAGLSGRHDLAAFFLEDLAVPLLQREATDQLRHAGLRAR